MKNQKGHKSKKNEKFKIVICDLNLSEMPVFCAKCDLFENPENRINTGFFNVL